MQYNEVMDRLKFLAAPDNVAGMARFGINPAGTLGVPIPALRKLAKEAGRDHDLAHRLWESRIHEARILASMVDNPKAVTVEQMEAWVKDFDSWDVCDQCCFNLFSRAPAAYEKAVEWSGREEEFVKRAGFALMARLAWSDKAASDERFEPFFTPIQAASGDGRNFVKKSVSWALRQIGKRNRRLNERAILAAREIQAMDSRSARWIASDALRELQSEAVQKRLA